MGENAGAPGAHRDELHVLVTGFGPWGANKANPSSLIAQAISEQLDVSGGPLIHIHTLPEPLAVSYHTVRSQIPPLLFPPVTGNPPPTFDLVVFIGLAVSRTYYSVETRAFRDGYDNPDVDGKVMDQAEKAMWKQLYGAPEMLMPRWEADAVWRRWKAQLPSDLDVRVSDNAGRYLCEFVYFTGLVEYWRQGRSHNRELAFLHVPEGHESASIEKGVIVAEALIKAIVESETAKGHLSNGRVPDFTESVN